MLTTNQNYLLVNINNENYSIVKDSFSWNLQYEAIGEINPATGKPTVSTKTTYHGNLEQALNNFIDDRTTGESVQELIQNLKLARIEVKEAIKCL